ncbi:MAG: TatD family hydrolase [Vibrio sp.]
MLDPELSNITHISDTGLIDSHCHFDFAEFEEIEKELAKAQQASVTKIIIPATGESNWQRVQQLSDEHDPLYYALGLHPYFIQQHGEQSIELLEKILIARIDKCVAVGECGLDFLLDASLMTDEYLERQHWIFEQQILLAKKYQLPLILHGRKSHDQILKYLRRHKPERGGVIHAFSGSEQQALEYIKLGFYIGVGGTITYERAQKTRNAVANLPVDSIVLETDAPDMPICGFQGQPNHPSRLGLILDALCSLRNESREKLQIQIWHNTCRLFNLIDKNDK